ncbi:MAG: hypothetical protein HOP28_02745, partial [Gemmatimonadales bacterium]|nr:hypothetical protein [Gemmatimonadales bacterium]
FENVTGAADIAWLRDASVNLLYLDMSKWQDIRVIDDERVADFIREVPEARGGAPLTLQSGIAVARRAGAGKLVMGDLLKIGPRTQVVGKVFDVKTGLRVRTVRQDAATTDSIMSAFGQLARAVLNVAPPAGTSLGSIGTGSVSAYQSYMIGVGFLNRWMLDSARTAFGRALALDSSFALAHYKLATVYGWQTPNSEEGPRHAALALRYGAALPQRERNLLLGAAALTEQRYAEACSVFSRLLAADSTDVEAWYNLGECAYHDPAVVPLAGDTTRFVFRSSWNLMLKAFRHALELDPTSHLAFQHIQDALLTRVRQGCRLPPGVERCGSTGVLFEGVLQRDADSLLIAPVSLATSTASRSEQLVAAQRQGARRANLEAARQVAEEWLRAGPGESRPRRAYARILLRLGRVAAADSILRGAGTGIVAGESAGYVQDRIEAAIKLGNPALAGSIADSLLRALAGAPPNQRNAAVILNATFGKVRDLDEMIRLSTPGQELARRYFTLQVRAILGVPSDGILPLEDSLARSVVGLQDAKRAAVTLAGSLLFLEPGLRGGRWPVADTASTDPRIALVSHLARSDRARVRSALAGYDSAAAERQNEPDGGLALVGALVHLAVGDSIGALRLLRRFHDGSWALSPIGDQPATGFGFEAMLWPRMFLLLGDLEAAAGRKDQAAHAYRMFIGFWQHADPELQPIVQRAREALTRLGS